MTVHPIHFGDYSGVQFERLVFAYHVRAGWHDLVWHDQSEGDQGRDIACIEEFCDRPVRRTIIQCANRDTLTLAKAKADMTKAIKAASGKANAFTLVCRGAVSDIMRTRFSEAATALGIGHVAIWSSVELAENLRLRAGYLLQRFVHGVEFPDAKVAIRKFVDDFPDMSDTEALQLMAAVFDRPAFRTPFQQESSLLASHQAMEDTIGALNTGVWKTRDAHEIRRIPSIHHLRDQRVRTVLAKTVQHVDALRRLFVERLREGAIKHCGCGQSDCPAFMLTSRGADELNEACNNVFALFRSVYAPFEVAFH